LERKTKKNPTSAEHGQVKLPGVPAYTRLSPHAGASCVNIEEQYANSGAVAAPSFPEQQAVSCLRSGQIPGVLHLQSALRQWQGGAAKGLFAPDKCQGGGFSSIACDWDKV